MLEEHPFLGVVFWITASLFFLWMIYMIGTAPKCKRGHYEMVHHEAYTTMITTSFKPLILVPIFHPAYDANEWICDERCGKNDPDKVCQ